MRTWRCILPLLAACLGAADLSHYRGFRLESDLAVAAKHAGANAWESRVLHKRPKLIEELDWQARLSLIGDLPGPDPVTGGLLYFYEKKLYRMVITYDRYRIEGLTAGDLIEAISRIHGPPTEPIAEIAFHSHYGELAKVLARWEDASSAYDLVRTGDQTGFALVLYSKKLDALAQSVILEAGRLDQLDAPRLEREKDSKRLEEARLTRAKTRATNKPNFRP